MPRGLTKLVREAASFAREIGSDGLVFMAVCAVVALFVAVGQPLAGLGFALLAIPAYIVVSLARMRHKVREYERQIDQDVRKKLEERTAKRKPPKSSMH
jgi:hypothetical protein